MIRAYIGGLGSGKSYSMVVDAVKNFRSRQPQVFCNMAGLKCPEAIYIEALNDLPWVASGLCLLDEMGIFMSSRAWQKTPLEVLQAFALGRKNGLDMYWSAHTMERVDAAVREITAEIVHCKRVGNVVLQTYLNPGDMKPDRRKIVRLDSRYFYLYDTLERISLKGGTMGSGPQAIPLSRVAKRRLDAERTAREKKARDNSYPLLRRNHLGYTVLVREARAAQEHLVDEGGWSSGLEWAEQIRRELLRRKWLREWGLKAEDAPYYCTPENPWLASYSPEAVTERREASDLAVAKEVVALDRIKRGARGTLAR